MTSGGLPKYSEQENKNQSKNSNSNNKIKIKGKKEKKKSGLSSPSNASFIGSTVHVEKYSFWPYPLWEFRWCGSWFVYRYFHCHFWLKHMHIHTCTSLVFYQLEYTGTMTMTINKVLLTNFGKNRNICFVHNIYMLSW